MLCDKCGRGLRKVYKRGRIAICRKCYRKKRGNY